MPGLSCMLPPPVIAMKEDTPEQGKGTLLYKGVFLFGKGVSPLFVLPGLISEDISGQVCQI